MRTNRTPWLDDLNLIAETSVTDSDGYETITETERTVHCTFAEGVNRTEFFEALKSGIRLTASAEIWAEDYQGEEKAVFEDKRYKIIRAFATGRGTIELSLSEVVR